jgi:hypothetical protein
MIVGFEIRDEGDKYMESDKSRIYMLKLIKKPRH